MSKYLRIQRKIMESGNAVMCDLWAESMSRCLDGRQFDSVATESLLSEAVAFLSRAYGAFTPKTD